MPQPNLLETAKNRTVQKIEKGAALAGTIAIALLAPGCAGSGGGVGSQSKAETEAKAIYDNTYRKASPVGKFLMQYLRTTQVALLDSNGGFFNNGFNSYYQFNFNNGCLENTAYDVAGGAIDVTVQSSSLFSSSSASVDGHIPTAAAYAYVDPSQPNDLIVVSGHDQSKDLRFGGVDDGADFLTPIGSQTQNVLTTYGCTPGVQVGYQYIGGDQITPEPTTSSYILRGDFPDIRPQ